MRPGGGAYSIKSPSSLQKNTYQEPVPPTFTPEQLQLSRDYSSNPPKPQPNKARRSLGSYEDTVLQAREAIASAHEAVHRVRSYYDDEDNFFY